MQKAVYSGKKFKKREAPDKLIGLKIFIVLIATFIIITFFLFNLLSSSKLKIEKIIEIKKDQNLKINREIGKAEGNKIIHLHVDFKVFINGKELNFNKEKYNEKHPFAHLHLSNPEGDKVIHFEGLRVPIGFFFKTLGFTLTKDCLIDDEGNKFCNDGRKKLRMFVNGKENFEFGEYYPRDLDKILISYGDATSEQIQKQIESVTNFACIYSRRCSEEKSYTKRSSLTF